MGFLFGGFMGEATKIGILYSTIGPMARWRATGVTAPSSPWRSCRRTAGTGSSRFVDPHGNIADYLESARFLLKDAGCRHIIGTITSLARKEVLPLVEKHDGLLWYMCPYEGFEADENVIYTGACIRQSEGPRPARMIFPACRERAGRGNRHTENL